MRNYAVGTRVQWEDRDTKEITGGTVDQVIPSKVQRTWEFYSLPEDKKQDMITWAHVKWDDGTEDSVDMQDLDPEDTPLEREFRTAASVHLEEIHKKVSEASKLLSEAVNISDKYGIPFYASVSFLGQSYFPNTFEEKYEGIDRDLVYGITEASSEYGYGGWEHSDVC